MQYTGKKDRYNKEIYEGDIIQGKIKVLKWSEIKHNVYEKEIEIKPTVVEYKEEVGFFPFLKWFMSYEDIIEENIEVIGNIYENKDLLCDNNGK